MLNGCGPNRYKVKVEGNHNVDPIVYANDSIRADLETESLAQLRNASKLKGVRFLAGMPDLHVGYGVPVGCGMGMDAEEGLVSAGAVGMDINCGMRLLGAPIKRSDLNDSLLSNIARQISKVIPLGIGTKSRHQSDLEEHILNILRNGVKALADLGYAREDDLPYIQDEGRYPGADTRAIPSKARDRLGQLSTLGGGNHFIEIDYVDTIYDDEAAELYGMEENQLTVTIHTGSRGFGHQICVDFSDRMDQLSDEFNLSIPNKELASAPINSELGQDYLSCMAAAANIAYANRQMISYDIRKIFENYLDTPDSENTLDVIYDITHNLARFEEFDGEELLMHRKGAIRALPPGHPDNPEPYRETGHPVIVPGHMGTGGYVLRATDNTRETCHTINHGAGRVMSRRQAKDTISESEFREMMENIILLGAERSKILDEAPHAYKDPEKVIDSLTEIDLAKRVARLKPLAVIKGD